MFIKFKAWLRQWLLMPNHPALSVTPTTVQEGAAQLVERARAGDQNAVAMICTVRDNAKKGIPQAKVGFDALEQYIAKNPIKEPVSFGAELASDRECDIIVGHVVASFGEDYLASVKTHIAPLAARSLPKAIVTYANGPSLLQDGAQNLFHDIQDSFTEKEQKAFVLGVKQNLSRLNIVPQELQVPFIVGHVLGSARKIQAVRHPQAPLSLLSTQLGYELGERPNGQK